MTPKEKAEEFYLKYQYRIENRLDKKHSKKYEKFLIKQCALIAVDEILSIKPHYFDEKQFWSEVKKELEKL